MEQINHGQQDTTFRIEITLDEDFKAQFQKLKKKYGEEMFAIEGLSKEDLNITNFFDKFMNSDNVANASIDDNSNVTDKNISIMLSESRKPYNKLLSHNKIYIELKESFGKEMADKWLDWQINGALYSHDSHESTLKPYCFAFSLKPIVEKGLYFIKDMKAHSAKHLDTFNHHVLEFVSYATNMQSGAVGIPDYLIYAYYFYQNDIKTGYMIDTETGGKLDANAYKRQKWQEILFNLNQPYLKGGEQSAYTNFSILDREHIIGLLGTNTFPDGSLIIDHLEKIMQYQKDFLDYERELRKEKFFTFPVISASLLFQDGKYVDEDMARFINKHNMEWQDVNIYNAKEVDALSSCCRLTSSLKDIESTTNLEDEDLKGHFNSIGGSSISIGSAKVNTINLVRIALESKGNFEKYKNILKDRIDISHKYLYVQREVLKKNIKKGLLPLYSYELLDMNRQFSTIGITGVFEAIKMLEGISENSTGVFYNELGLGMTKEILDIIGEANKTTKKLYGYNANTEQIPSESCSIKICKKDKLIFGQDCINTYIYGNQWIPLNQHCDVMERIRVSSVLDEACGGGVMCHVNLAEKFENEEQAWLMMNKLAKEGVVYFSFILKINVCKNDHSFYGEKCPICGGEVTDSYIKIVGYLVKTSSYKKERGQEMKERVFYNI
jgi:ribonucleoside-triphosphate reductase